MEQRILKLQNSFLRQNNSAAFILSDINRFYFTGFSSSNGALLILKDEAYFLTDFRYIGAAKHKIKHCNVLRCDNINETVNKLILEKNIENLYLEQNTLNVKTLLKFKEIFEDISLIYDNTLDDFIEKMRMIKSDKEIEKIKIAQKITDNAFKYILNYIAPGKTEKDIALELEFFMRKNGAERIAFDIIAVSGKNSSLPHGVPTEKPIQKGGFLTLDFGASVDGYKSDMTRTIGIGNIIDEQKEIYNIVLKAQTEALKLAKHGEICSNVDLAARNIIKNAGYGEYFGHATGHSVGLEIHERPVFSIKCSKILEKNMIMTVEPGIYLPEKFGVRIEDLIIIDNNTNINLTNSDKSLIIL